MTRKAPADRRIHRDGDGHRRPLGGRPGAVGREGDPASIKLGESSALQWTPREDRGRDAARRDDGGRGAAGRPLRGHALRPAPSPTSWRPMTRKAACRPANSPRRLGGRPGAVGREGEPGELGESSALQWTPREDVANVVVTLPDGTTADVAPEEGRYVVTPDAVGKITYMLCRPGSLRRGRRPDVVTTALRATFTYKLVPMTA